MNIDDNINDLEGQKNTVIKELVENGAHPKLLEQFDKLSVRILGYILLRMSGSETDNDDEGDGGSGVPGGDEPDDSSGGGAVGRGTRDYDEEVFSKLEPGDYFMFTKKIPHSSLDHPIENIVDTPVVWVRKQTCIVCVINECYRNEIGTAVPLSEVDKNNTVTRVDPIWQVQSPLHTRDPSGAVVVLAPDKGGES